MQSRRTESRHFRGKIAPSRALFQRPRQPPAAARTVLVFIDPRVTRLSHLTRPGGRHPGIIALDPAADGLRQIAAVLAATPGVQAIVVVAHGAAGGALLGSATLAEDTLAGHATTLRAIGRALGQAGAILLYGCAAASQGFVGAMAAHTRTQVAAPGDDMWGMLGGGRREAGLPLADA